MWSESHAWVWEMFVLIVLILQIDNRQRKTISSGFLNTNLFIFGFFLIFWCLGICQSTGWSNPSRELRAQENCSPKPSLVLAAASISVPLIPQVTIPPQPTVPAGELNCLAPSGTPLEVLTGCDNIGNDFPKECGWLVLQKALWSNSAWVCWQL